MTLKQLIKLASKHRTWEYHGPTIRCSNGLCLIIAAHRSKFPGSEIYNGDFDIAAKDLGITRDFALRIVEAADSTLYYQKLRHKIEKGLGLV